MKALIYGTQTQIDLLPVYNQSNYLFPDMKEKQETMDWEYCFKDTSTRIHLGDELQINNQAWVITEEPDYFDHFPITKIKTIKQTPTPQGD